MIVWLASYPRSGNTLLRTICRRCFGMVSYADEPVNYESEFRSNPDLIGHAEYQGEWHEFYTFASRSKEIFLVKTHQAPIDDQPFIYIVRDGRDAIRSYQRFMKNYNNVAVPLVNLILGLDVYGDWSGHYRSWNLRPAKDRLLFRFEDLVHLTDRTVARIASFIKYNSVPHQWHNPVDQLKTIEPNFFNAYQRDIAGGEAWTPSHEYLFGMIHGALMHDLQYDDMLFEKSDAAGYPDHMHQMIDDLIAVIHALHQEKSSLMITCEERLALIHKLNDICEERLALIDRLKGMCEERLRLIEKLNSQDIKTNGN